MQNKEIHRNGAFDVSIDSQSKEADQSEDEFLALTSTQFYIPIKINNCY